MAHYVKPVILENIMDINKIIFSRTAPAKKVEIVKNLFEAPLLTITPDTIKRMVKETGTKLYQSRDKQLRLSNYISNDWNACIKGVRTCKGNLYVDIYLQYENTDADTSVSLQDFLAAGEYRGSIIRSDRHGNDRHYYFYFTQSEKAEYVRELLLTYLHIKYPDKL